MIVRCLCKRVSSSGFYPLFATTRDHSSKMKRDVTPADFRYFLPLQTRSLDSDFNHHVNNSVYTSFWNTMLQTFLQRHCPDAKEYGGMIVWASNDFLKPATFPHMLLGGMKITSIGANTINLQYGIFNPNNDAAKSRDTRNYFHDNDGKGFIVRSSRDIEYGAIQNAFETSPCMIGSTIYMFKEHAVDNAKDISVDLKKQMESICDAYSRL